MATAIHIETIVLPGGKIEVTAPELTPGQRATVFVITETVAASPAEKPHSSADILTEMPGRLMFKTAEEVDAYIREERDSWDC